MQKNKLLRSIAIFLGLFFTCYSCNAPCVTCQTFDSSACTSCDTDNNFQLSGNFCLCAAGYYLNGQCDKCPPGCLTCSSPNACIQCVDSINVDGQQTRLPEPQLLCLCKSGYFENGTQICPKCDDLCLTCSITADNCETCDSSKNLILALSPLGGGTCVCQQGFKLVTTANGDVTCKQQPPLPPPSPANIRASVQQQSFRSIEKKPKATPVDQRSRKPQNTPGKKK